MSKLTINDLINFESEYYQLQIEVEPGKFKTFVTDLLANEALQIISEGKKELKLCKTFDESYDKTKDIYSKVNVLYTQSDKQKVIPYSVDNVDVINAYVLLREL